MEFLKAYVRAKDEHRQVIARTLQVFDCAGFDFPWKVVGEDEFTTMLLDLLELIEFVPAPHRQEGEYAYSKP